ncbi:unnamed protein product [Rhizoctonia solani]|uniref:Uncharacterized protein n=1 Tax=Rhizoctonia solani TaxID=456999 RepID=A0A8H3EE80_9AGAM|nr:unnamed protein product [Rhizoctonia solani]
MEQAALRVFGIPELAHLICSTIQKADNVSLMRTCRQLFHDILPFVWEDVDQANSLVSLIPGGGIIIYDSDFSPYVVMQLPSRLELARFNIYAPHVKRLTPTALHIDEYDGWESFLACVRSIDLLPNLDTLCLPVRDHTQYTSYGGDETVETNCVNWVTAFLSSSLRTLELGYRKQGSHWDNRRVPWMDFGLFDSFMVSVSQKCLGLRSLSVLPASVMHDNPRSRRVLNGIPRVSFSRDVSLVYWNFLQLENLTSLRVSLVILNLEGVLALSALPRLETLSVLGYEFDNRICCNGLELPTEGFPALRHLELVLQSWSTIGNLCSAKPIVSGLHSMTIVSPLYLSEGQYHSLHDVIPLLAASNSSATTLIVRNYRDSYNQLPPSALQYWRQLPLINLHLEGSVKANHTFNSICSIVSCLPLLEVFKLSMTQGSLDLRKLGKIIEHLPRLRHIRAPLRWKLVTELVEADFAPCRSKSNVTLYLESNFYLPNPQQENAERLARYLSALRPSAAVICQSHQRNFYSRAAGGYVDEGPKDMINAELSQLRHS